MINLVASDLAFGALVVALVILYAAWHEASAKNARDASLLAAMGFAGLLGSAVA